MLSKLTPVFIVNKQIVIKELWWLLVDTSNTPSYFCVKYFFSVLYYYYFVICLRPEYIVFPLNRKKRIETFIYFGVCLKVCVKSGIKEGENYLFKFLIQLKCLVWIVHEWSVLCVFIIKKSTKNTVKQIEILVQFDREFMSASFFCCGEYRKKRLESAAQRSNLDITSFKVRKGSRYRLCVSLCVCCVRNQLNLKQSHSGRYFVWEPPRMVTAKDNWIGNNSRWTYKQINSKLSCSRSTPYHWLVRWRQNVYMYGENLHVDRIPSYNLHKKQQIKLKQTRIRVEMG